MRRSARRQRLREQRHALQQPAQPLVTYDGLRIDPVLAASARARRTQPITPFKPAEHPKGFAPSPQLAMDDAFNGVEQWAQGQIGTYFGENGYFLGFPQLALLAQRPEYRRIVEVIATEATRKGVKITASGEDKANKVKEIEKAFQAFGVVDLLRAAAEGDGFMGRGHLYLDLGARDDAELATPIGYGGADSKAKVAKGSLKDLRTVEAMWCYPQGYNASDPLSPDWYRPTHWVVQGKRIHVTRLLTFIGRDVPDLLKAAYSFGGLSLTQMAMPYVQNWLRTRQSVSDLISAYSVMVLKTKMGNQLGAVGQNLFDRIELFNNLRDNRGLMTLDKDTEDFSNVSAQLGTLDALQAQAQEQMASVSGIPLVKLLGISPHGLNASSEGEIRVFYDWVHAYQERLFRPNLTRLLGFIQLHLFGEVDPEITFSFEPLWSMSEKEMSEVRKIDAETGQILIEGGVLAPAEERQRVAEDPDTLYHGLDVADVPNLEEEAEAGLEAGEGGEHSLLGRLASEQDGDDDGLDALNERFNASKAAA